MQINDYEVIGNNGLVYLNYIKLISIVVNFDRMSIIFIKY